MQRKERALSVMPPPRLSELQTALCIVFLLLAPLALAGLALMSAGLGRSRNAAHAMMAALCVVAVAACMYFFRGAALQGYGNGAGYTMMLGGKPWNWAGRGSFLMLGIPLNASPAFLAAWFGILGAAMAGMIPLGSGADRRRLPAICASTALLSGITFPLVAHWSWGTGWLAQLGANYGLGHGYLDAGGAGAIHMVGGLTALSLAWLLGARRGKYTADGMPMAIPGHNAVYVLFGCLLVLAGWLGLNAAGAPALRGRIGYRPHSLVAVTIWWLCAVGQRPGRLPSPPEFVSASPMLHSPPMAGREGWSLRAPPAPSSLQPLRSWLVLPPELWSPSRLRCWISKWTWTIRAGRSRFTPSAVSAASSPSAFSDDWKPPGPANSSPRPWVSLLLSDSPFP